MKVLLFSPHPDDFIFFMGATFLAHLEQGDSVTCVLATAGEKGSLFSFLPGVAQRLAEVRMREAKRGLEQVQNLHWVELGLKEGTLSETLPEAVLTRLFAEPDPFDVIYLPEFKKRVTLYRHPDHLALTTEVLRWLSLEESRGGAIKIRFYHSKGEDWTQEVQAYEDKVRALIRNHQSQFSIFAYPLLLLHFGLILRSRYIKRKQPRTEGFRQASGDTLMQAVRAALL